MMRINDDSICCNCENFEHECNVPCGEGDYECHEICEESIDTFYEFNEIIKACDKFKCKR